MAYGDQLVAGLGPGHDGWTLVGITKEPDKVSPNPDKGTINPTTKQPEPDTISTPTGRWIATFSTPGGQTRTAALVPGAKTAGPGASGGGANIDPNTPGADLTKVNWDIVEGPQDLPQGSNPNLQNAQIAQAQAAADASRASTEESNKRAAQLQSDLDQIEKNRANGLGGLTDQQVATLNQQAAAQGLTQQQIDLQRQQITNSNDASKASNQVALLNAQIAAKNSDQTATYQDAYLKYLNGQLDKDNLAQVYQQTQNQIANNIAQQNADTNRLNATTSATTAATQATTAAGQLGVSQQNAAETARHNAATEAQAAAAAQATAQASNATTSMQAAKAILDNATGANAAVSQQAQTGASLLNQRVSSAAGALSNITGNLLGNQNIMRSIPGLGANLVNGLSEWVTQLGGGQPVYDAAAAMVNQANPTINGNPEMRDQAYQALRGMMDLYKQQTGQDYQPPDKRDTGPITSPVTTGGTLADGTPMTNVNASMNPAAANPANAQGQLSTAALNAQGLMDNPQGRAIAAGQTPVATVSPVTRQPITSAPSFGQYTPAYQQGIRSAVGQPATGPVVGAIAPLPIPQWYGQQTFQAPVTA